MTSDERELKRLVARRLPSHMEFVAARDRVLNELGAAPPHLQKPRLADPPPAPSEPGGRVEGPAVSWLRTALPLTAAAALIAIVATVSFRQGDWLATVEAADGSKYTLKPNEVMRASTASGTMLTLVDGSRVEMRSQSELSLARAADGVRIRLGTGGIIVNAAEQRSGRLYVETKDMTVSVVGTVFVVNAAEDGSRVAVIEGEVEVRDGSRETKLRPGEQVSTNPTVQGRPVAEEIAWSPRKDAYLALLPSAVAAAPANQQVSTPPAAGGQAASTEFEEASIRPCDPNNLPPGGRGGPAGANTFRMTPGRTYGTCLTLATLIRIAYG
jgi:ferric-dicitrate binding protein FerR (iron transport regulator)